jgi:hypothetical protein
MFMSEFFWLWMTKPPPRREPSDKAFASGKEVEAQELVMPAKHGRGLRFSRGFWVQREFKPKTSGLDITYSYETP